MTRNRSLSDDNSTRTNVSTTICDTEDLKLYMSMRLNSSLTDPNVSLTCSSRQIPILVLIVSCDISQTAVKSLLYTRCARENRQFAGYGVPLGGRHLQEANLSHCKERERERRRKTANELVKKAKLGRLLPNHTGTSNSPRGYDTCYFLSVMRQASQLNVPKQPTELLSSISKFESGTTLNQRGSKFLGGFLLLFSKRFLRVSIEEVDTQIIGQLT